MSFQQYQQDVTKRDSKTGFNNHVRCRVWGVGKGCMLNAALSKYICADIWSLDILHAGTACAGRGEEELPASLAGCPFPVSLGAGVVGATGSIHQTDPNGARMV